MCLCLPFCIKSTTSVEAFLGRYKCIHTRAPSAHLQVLRMTMPPTVLACLLWQHEAQAVLRTAHVARLLGVRKADPFALVASLRAHLPASFSQPLLCNIAACICHHDFGELQPTWHNYKHVLEQ